MGRVSLWWLSLMIALLLGCTSTAGSAGGSRAAGSTPTAAPTATKMAELPTVEVNRAVESASPTTEAQPTPVAEGAQSYPEASPTAVVEATPPASAESSNPAPVQRPVDAPVAYSPQIIPLYPFQPVAGRARLVALDPGHGGAEVGAAGAGLGEKTVNLAIAMKLRKLLEDDGMQVVLTRDGDRRAYVLPDDKAPEGYSATRFDIQTRIDIANRAQADVYISIHNNGSADPGQSGTEVWYDGKRPFGAFNQALAEETLPSLVGAIRSAGYWVADRGIKEDSNFRTFNGRAFPIFVLGPPRTGSSNTRATQMPAILGETLFLSNPLEAEQLRRDDVVFAIARGYQEGLRRYFLRIESGALTLPPEGLPLEKPNHFDLRPPSSADQR